MASSPQDNFYISRKSLNKQQQNISNDVHWAIKLLYAAVVLSFVVSFGTNDISHLIDDIESEIRAATAHLDHVQTDREKVYRYIHQERILLNKYKKTRKALGHEVRILKEIRESSGRPMTPKPRNEKMIQSWLSHRKEGLLNKAQYLQSYLQYVSQKELVRKYGDGPHKVKFTIDISPTNGQHQYKSFLVELAPVHSMPQSIYFFLDMISNKLWDHTIFLHHEDMDHVLAAAPIDFDTQKAKRMEIYETGWTGLGFPEYTVDIPHEKYTLGFSGQGPTFYINSHNNTLQHGPGGQDHHLLATDADPCFGKVVQGKEVVDELIRVGGNVQPKTHSGQQHHWLNSEHSWTRIVSVELVNDTVIGLVTTKAET